MLQTNKPREWKLAIGKWAGHAFDYKVYTVTAQNKRQATKLAKAMFKAESEQLAT